MSLLLNKNNLKKTENKINRNIYLLPIILGLIVIFSFTFIIYNSVEEYRNKQLNNLSVSLINKEKLNSKKELEQIINRIEMLKKNTETQLKKISKIELMKLIPLFKILLQSIHILLKKT